MKYFIPLILIIFSFSCKSDSSRNIPTVVTPEEQKLLNQLSAERNQSATFIKNESEYKKGVFGNMNIFLKVQNGATYTTYKDVKVEMVYLSKTNATLGAPFYETVYETLPPGRMGAKNLKYKCPKDAEKVSVRVIKATVVSQK